MTRERRLERCLLPKAVFSTFSKGIDVTLSFPLSWLAHPSSTIPRVLLFLLAASCGVPEDESVAESTVQPAVSQEAAVLATMGTFQQATDGSRLVSVEAEDFHRQNSDSTNHQWKFSPTTTVASSSLYVEALPNSGAALAYSFANANILHFDIQFVAGGQQAVWIRSSNCTAADNSIHVAVNGTVQLSSFATPPSCDWTWTKGLINVPSVGKHTVQFAMHKDGFKLDKFVITPNLTYIPTALGPPESPRSAVFPVTTDRTQIELVSTDSLVIDGKTYRRQLYRNKAYRCGVSGYFTFIIIERVGSENAVAPLWVWLQGGGVGHFDNNNQYQGSSVLINTEPNASTLTGSFGAAFTNSSAGYIGKQVVIPRRLQQGYRVLSSALCDHDLYGGMGNIYPNDPNWAGQPPDRVEGLQATISAILFAAKGNELVGAAKIAPHPTSLLFLHGGSAGSAGSYHVAAAMARMGLKPNGAILDSYLVNPNYKTLVQNRCTPVTGDPQWSMTAFEQKVGSFLTDPKLGIDENLNNAFTIPMFDVVGDQDSYCCGPSNVIPAAQSAGFNNNCKWARSVFAQAAVASGGRLQSFVAPGLGHIITHTEGAHQAAIESWLARILAQHPHGPAF